MKSFDEDTLRDMLVHDYVGRNNQLSTLITFINSLDESTTLAIDSAWGSGKTVFVKQLELLNYDNTITAPHRINKDALQLFRTTYSAYYFNAWENDFLDDPLQALIYNLINDLSTEGLQEKSAKRGLNMIDVPELVKNISKGGINISKSMPEDEMIKEIKSVIDRKQHVHDLLDKYTSKTEKKLLFIVDELDRCKPSFAVNLLEAIKHYFTDKGIVFLIATDNTQLAHTVCKYYGNNFNGAAYLNKFFDFNTSLQHPDKEKYLREYLRERRFGYIPMEIANYLNLSLREIETYLKALDLIRKYILREGYFRKDKATNEFCQWMFAPFALALKICRPADHKMFMSGKGEDLLRDLYSGSNAIAEWSEHFVEEKTPNDESKALDLLLSTYRSIFTNDDTYHAQLPKNEFIDAVNLINQFTLIPSKRTADE